MTSFLASYSNTNDPVTISLHLLIVPHVIVCGL